MSITIIQKKLHKKARLKCSKESGLHKNVDAFLNTIFLHVYRQEMCGNDTSNVDQVTFSKNLLSRIISFVI